MLLLGYVNQLIHVLYLVVNLLNIHLLQRFVINGG